MTTERIVVVGSGASGVHFALTLLQKGRNVTMIDVGRQGPAPVAPKLTFSQLKEQLEDPSSYFLGAGYEGVLLPGSDGEYYGVPPNKDFIFEGLSDFGYSTRGFAPLFSFARGGLAEAWTAGCYPLNAGEVADFPFAYESLEKHYGEVARRIGITGELDDLAQFMPLHDHLLAPLRLDAHSQKLIHAYQRRRDRINRDIGSFVGRTRVATLSQPHGGRKPCEYLGRCLWGCPHEALYTPSQTLRECQTYRGFEYVSGREVDYFRLGPGARIRSVVTRALNNGGDQEFPVDRLVLAAGTLLSSRIVMHSVLRATGERVHLRGLMDNRQVLVPFLNPRMLGEAFSADSYQYHLLGMGIRSADPRDYVHGQITTLKTAMLHPIIQNLPFDLRTSTFVTRSVRAALGIVNVNFRDTRRDENYIALSGGQDGERPRLKIHYEPSVAEPAYINDGLRKVKRTLRTLGCFVPPGMMHVRPMGASVHYAGTLPMTKEASPFTTNEHCQSRDFQNLFVVDGSTFPFLPAKNITFTLMANAIRVANVAF